MADVYSGLCVKTIKSPNRNSPRNHAIDTITIHCTAGHMSVDGITSWFGSSTSQVSCNYAIAQDGKIVGVVPEGDRSWCSSSRDNDNRALTIEVSTAKGEPYAPASAAYESLITLLVDICRRNGIKQLLWQNDKNLIGKPEKQNMTVHRWFSSTACPGTWLMEHMPQIAKSVNDQLGTAAVPNSPQKLYRVQVGAYSVKANAEDMLAKIKNAGFDAYVTYG